MSKIPRLTAVLACGGREGIATPAIAHIGMGPILWRAERDVESVSDPGEVPFDESDGPPRLSIRSPLLTVMSELQRWEPRRILAALDAAQEQSAHESLREALGRMGAVGRAIRVCGSSDDMLLDSLGVYLEGEEAEGASLEIRYRSVRFLTNFGSHPERLFEFGGGEKEVYRALVTPVFRAGKVWTDGVKRVPAWSELGARLTVPKETAVHGAQVWVRWVSASLVVLANVAMVEDGVVVLDRLDAEDGYMLANTVTAIAGIKPSEPDAEAAVRRAALRLWANIAVTGEMLEISRILARAASAFPCALVPLQDLSRLAVCCRAATTHHDHLTPSELRNLVQNLLFLASPIESSQTVPVPHRSPRSEHREDPPWPVQMPSAAAIEAKKDAAQYATSGLTHLAQTNVEARDILTALISQSAVAASVIASLT